MSEIRVENIIGETGADAVKFTKGINVTGIATASNVSVGSSVTATSFFGSGANLTGLSAGIIKMNLRLDGNRASYNPVVTGNSFTSGTELSNLTISMTPTNATTIFLITGNIYITQNAPEALE